MRTISAEGRQRLEDYRGDWLIKLVITPLSGDPITVTRDNVWGGSLTIDDAVGQAGSFAVGSTVINQMHVSLFSDSGAYDNFMFRDATVQLSIGCHTGTIVKGYYTVVDIQRDDAVINLTCYDYMHKFSRSYKISTLTYPKTLKQIISNACTVCGVTDGTGNFTNYNTSIAKRPDDDTLTFRELIGYVAQIAGCNARISYDGKLKFVQYNLDGFNTSGAYNVINEVYSSRIDADTITITGVHVDEENTVTTTDADGISTTSVVVTGYDATGSTDGYVLNISGNPLIKSGLGQTVANTIMAAYGGKPFEIGSITHASDFCIEAGDIMKVTDNNGTHNMLVSSTTFSTGSAQTTGSYSLSPTSTDAVQYSDMDKIKTVVSEAHVVAIAAQTYANDAKRAASAAQDSADDAATAAQTAWNHADDALTAANSAQGSADAAATAASNAQTSANNAATAASNAQTSANNAQTQADLATGYAGNALIQLSEVEQVADILTWIAEHGTYTRTSDTTIVPQKNYYTKSGDVYTLVTDPKQSEINTYYELHIDEAVSNYISTHLALTNDGLYVVKESNGYRLKVTNSNIQIIDGSGTTVATYGSSISYDSTREHTIGDSNTYIKWYDSNNDSVADALAIVANSITLGNTDVSTALTNAQTSADNANTKIDNMQIGGRNLIRNTNSIDLSEYATRPNINGYYNDGTHLGNAEYPTGAIASEHGIKAVVSSATAPYVRFGTSSATASTALKNGTFGLEKGKQYTWSFDYEAKILSGTISASTTFYLRAYLNTYDGSAWTAAEYVDLKTIPVADRGQVMSGRAVFTFTIPNDAQAIYLIVRSNTTTASYYASGDYIDVRNLKLEEGNKATAWSPAPEDVDKEVAEAEKVARNYLSVDSTGSRVADMTSGQTETPGTATGRNVFITNNDVQIRDGQTSLASYGDSTRIGKTDEAHMNIESGGIKGIDGNGNTFFDLDVSGSTTTRWVYQELNRQLSVGQSTTFEITDESIVSGTTIYVAYKTVGDGYFVFTHGTASTEASDYCSCTYSANGQFTFTYDNALQNVNKVIVYGIEYQSNSVAPSLIFGSHTGAIGNYSVALGEGLKSDSDYMTAIGRFNASSQGTLFVVGNGTDSEHRSDAFVVSDYGGTSIGGPLSVDEDIWATKNIQALQCLMATKVYSYTPTWASGEAGADFYCVVSAGICHLMYQGQSKTHSADALLFSLPVDCRPAVRTNVPFVKGSVAYGFISISTGGEVTVKAISSTTQTGRIYFNCSFPVAELL